MELTVCHGSNLSNLKLYKTNNYRVIENHIEPEYSYLNVELSIIEISVIWFVADYIMFCESQGIGSILEQVLSLYVYLFTLMDCSTFYYLLIFFLPGTTPCRSSLPQANETNYIAKAMEKQGPCLPILLSQPCVIPIVVSKRSWSMKMILIHTYILLYSCSEFSD